MVSNEVLKRSVFKSVSCGFCVAAVFVSSRVKTASGFRFWWVCGSSSSRSSCCVTSSLVTTFLCCSPMTPGTSSSCSSSPSPMDTWPVSACAMDPSKKHTHTHTLHLKEMCELLMLHLADDSLAQLHAWMKGSSSLSCLQDEGNSTDFTHQSVTNVKKLCKSFCGSCLFFF